MPEATVTPSGSVLLYVDRPSPIPSVPGFTKMTDHHITLVGHRIYNSAWAKQIGHAKVMAVIREAVEYDSHFNVEWPDKPLCVVTQNKDGVTSKSVVKWADVHGITDLYARLLLKGIVVSPAPPMHCTLLTQGCDGAPFPGIGIYSMDDPYLSFSDLVIAPDPVPTGGRIVLPDDDEGARLLTAVKRSWFDKCGPRYTRLVGLALRNVVEAFRLDPLTLAEEISGDINGVRNSSNTQLAFVAYICPKDMDKYRNAPGGACAKYMHSHYHSSDNIFHYKVLAWSGSSVEVCRKLKELFSPVTTRPGLNNTGRIALPGLESLEDRVGLTDFMKGE